MSVLLSRVRNSRGSRARIKAVAAVAAATVITLGTATLAFADDVDVDGDLVKSPPHVQYDDVENSANHMCNTRGAAVAGSIVLAYSEGGSNPKHYTAGELLDVQITDSQPGITVSQPASTSIPATWAAGSTLTIPITTTVTTAVPQGTHTVSITVVGAAVTRTDSYNVTVSTDCAVVNPNTAPTVTFTTAPVSAPEGSNVNYAFAITDPDAGNTWTFKAGSPSCGTEGTLVSGSASINNAAKTGSFTCNFPDGLVPAQASSITVQVTDSANADSNVANASTTVTNVDPVVAKPTFDLTTIDCRQAVVLDGISFTDPGADASWSINVDWGDGSTDTVLTAGSQGPYSPDPSHTYNTPGGPYTATVTVTDKDGGVGSNTSSNTVTVQQAYDIDFLPPFDDSSPESGLIVNKMKNGRVVPVKAKIFDVCADAYVTDPNEIVTIKTSKTGGTGTGDPVEEYADAGASASNTNRFRWSSDGFWIYNLDSKALGLVVNNNYRVDVYVDNVQATDDSWAVLQPVK